MNKQHVSLLSVLAVMVLIACFTPKAQAQENLVMHTGSVTIVDSHTYHFYDSGGPNIKTPEEDPNNDYNWASMYQHNERHTLHLINNRPEDRGIKVIFNYLLINNDTLRFYEGDIVSEEYLIAEFCNNEYSSDFGSDFAVVSHGNMTVTFTADYHWRDLGWDATLELYAYAPQPPVPARAACSNLVYLLPTCGSLNANGAVTYYTIDGNDPEVPTKDPLSTGTLYTGPFEITGPTEVRAITVVDEVVSSVSSNSFTLITPPAAPTIQRIANTNQVVIDAHKPTGLNDTYYVQYSIDGSDPTASSLYAKDRDTVELTQPCTVRAVVHGTTCPDLFSAENSESYTTIYVPTPVITFDGEGETGLATITCSLTTATLYFTTDGSTPTTASTQYLGAFQVTAGTTVKAIAIKESSGFVPSVVATAVYIPGGAGGSGTFGDVVILDDREPHSWSYYSDGEQPVHSLKPADVKITYYGFGENTMTTTDTADEPSTFDGDVAAADVAVGPNDSGNQFVYLKTLENANEDGSGNYPYTMIPNPFSKRPAYESDGGSTPPEPTIETIDVVDGTGTNEYSPMYTYYANYGFKSEYIIPASYFTTAGINNGDKLTSITLYQASTGNWTAASLTIKLLNSTTNGYGGNTGYLADNGTTVYTNSSYNSGSQSSHTFSFSTPFEYSGNNVIIQISSGHNGTRGTTSWYGISSSSGDRLSWYGYYDSNNDNTYSGTRQRFLPKTTFTVQKENSAASDKYRGFYAWRVKRLSGVTITGYSEGDIIPAEEEIEFVATPNSTDGEVDFEALWAQAYVVTSNTATGLNANVSYERNFVVTTSSITAELNVPVTYSTYNPDGTGGSASTVTLNNSTLNSDTKFEYINLTGGNTVTANNHYLCFGRGISTNQSAAGTVQGINAGATNLNYTIRMESGRYDLLSFVRNSNTTVSGIYLVKSILGCDYDRATGTNNLLSVSRNNSLFLSTNVTFSGQGNKDQKTFDLVIKSGEFQRTIWEGNNNDGSYTRSFYCGQNSSGNTYPGMRYVTVEGGELGSMNGGRGVGGTSTNYATPDVVTFDLRIKGGTFHGAVFGGAADNPSIGSRRIVITNGSILGWVAAGANGTGSVTGSSAQTVGNSFIYVGGNSTIGGGNVTVNNTPGGNVFGAGRGNTNQMCSIEVSNVVVADEATIYQNVYGAGYNGYTEEISNVYVLGGNVKQSVFGGGYNHSGNFNNTPKNIPVSNVIVKGGKVDESVYGGSNSSGTVQNDSIYMSGGTVTNVYGGGLGANTVIGVSTDVNIAGGTINNNVYGGGELGTVTGDTEVNVSGGTMKNIFGAGKGGSTTANIGGTTMVTVSGGTVSECVYGGGENGNVKQASNPTSKDVEPEGSRDINPVSTVEITGGNIGDNVFGGGSMGFTNGGTVVNMSGGMVEGSVYGGAFGSKGKVYVAGQRTVNMRGGTVNKNVYGGSRNADDALTFNPGSFAGSTAMGTASVVNFAGGFVHYQVFASGYFGNVFGSTYAFIGINAILNAPNHVAGTAPYDEMYYDQHQALRIGGSVWAGGDFGNYDGSKFGDPTISGRSNIYIDGSEYDTESTNTTNTNYMNISGSVYGSGTSCDAGKQGRYIILRNYGKVIAASTPTDALPFSSATRSLYSIQRADSLVIDNAHVVFIGEGKINSLVTTEKYSIHEFKLVRMANGSSLFLNTPADQLKKFGSYTCPNVYVEPPQYTVVNYDELGQQGGGHDNKIRVNNGAYLQVKYTDENNLEQYSELEGFAYMMTDDENNTCAYARPKQSTDPGNIINEDYDNPDDGGFVSYDTEKNTYDIDGGTVENGIQMPYENHTLARNGEDYFRIWRAGGTYSYREGVFVAQSDGTTNYSTVDVHISLPAFKGTDGYYYRIQSNDGNTTIDMGTDVATVNAACYGDVGDDEWMSINGNSETAEFDLGQSAADLTQQLQYILENPNVNFGLVAIPQGGMETNETMLICEQSDMKIATMHWTNTHNEKMPNVTFRLTYNNNLTNNVVWDPVIIIFEQVGPNGDVVATVKVALTVTTLTNIEQDFVTQAYAIMRGTGTGTESYTAKIVLPQYVMHMTELGELSQWTCTGVSWEANTEYNDTTNNVITNPYTDAFVAGTNYLTHNDEFGMQLVAGLNFDNTTGWEEYPLQQKDLYGWNNTSYVFGKTTARNPIGFDFTMGYDGRQTFDGNRMLGTLVVSMHFTNYEPVHEPWNKDLTIRIEVWFLGQGANYYIDGVNGNNLYSGEYPNAAKKTLSGIFNRSNYRAGDNIFVVDTIKANGSNTLVWNGKTYSEVTLYRYPGGHKLIDQGEIHYEGYTDRCYQGPLVSVSTNMEMTGIVLNGFYKESLAEEGEAVGDDEGHLHTYVPSIAPLVEILDGGSLSVYGSSRMEYNYNASTDAGGVMVNNGGVLNIYDGSSIDTNYVATGKNGAGVYVNSTSKVQLGDVVVISGNKQGIPGSKADEGVDNNVYLSTYDSHVDVGTVDTDDPYNKLITGAEIGITKNPNWGNYWYAPVAYSDGGQNYLSNLIGGGIIYDDQNRYDLVSLNNTHLDPPTDYLYFVGTWVTEVTSQPEGFKADSIDTPQELAWAISIVNGLNGATATPGQNFTLTGDIDMNANIWVPIGSSNSNYAGTFNGNGHVVTGLRSPMNQENMGMFGITNGATINNMVAVANFAGGTMKNIGTVIGTMKGTTTLSNIEAAGNLTGTNATNNIGGLVGLVEGGTIHSAFAVDTLSGGTSTVVGGLVGTNGGNLYNSYADVMLASGNTATTPGGLVGTNTGTIENCYVINPIGPAFAATNNGTINYCYSDTEDNYVGEGSTDPVGSGYYDAVKGRKELGYLYDDNKVNASNSYVAGEITYAGGQLATWPGLLSTLNQWVAANPKSLNPAPTSWFRPITQDLNGDLPILAFPKDNCLGNYAEEDGKLLRYSAYDLTEGKAFNNGLDDLLTHYSGKEANIFLYGNATDVANGSGSAKLFINEDAVLLQSANNVIEATVGITFDNSCKEADDYFGNTLLYDWHLMSTPLANAPLGISYSNENIGYGNDADWTQVENSYMPNMTNGSKEEEGVKWDFYTYYEPQYHWINFKRSLTNHWHYDDPHSNIVYNGMEQTGDPETDKLIKGRGYMMAINQDSYLNNTGTLNYGAVPIALTVSGDLPESELPSKDWGSNLVGNPYQAYLDLDLVAETGHNTFYIYDAETGVYGPYMTGASVNSAIPPKYIHPHQAFFVVTTTKDDNFAFSYDMATADTLNSHFRGGEQPKYPLVNIFVENESGNRDLAVIEFNRPVLDGVRKVNNLRNANFKVSGHLDGQDFGLMFTPEGTERVPVHFGTTEDGTFTMKWETMHGTFTSLILVDNLTGTRTDMLRNDHYTFNGSVDDYAARFYITYNVTDVDEINGNGDAFAWFDGYDWIVNGKGQLEVVDMTGRVLYSQRVNGEQVRLRLDGYAAGVYMLRLSGNKNVKAQKIVVK